MSREKEPPLLINMDDLDAKRQFMSHIGTLRGRYEITLRPRRYTRSNNANAYYWSAVVMPFTHYLREEWGDPSISKDQAHAELKLAVLGPKVLINKSTGEVKELVPTSHDLDTAEFAQFIEGCIEFLGRACRIAVPSSEEYYGKAA
jgi:hypothetical protein